MSTQPPEINVYIMILYARKYLNPKTNSAEKRSRNRKTRHGPMEDTGFWNSAFTGY